jgi:hypothetical protein
MDCFQLNNYGLIIWNKIIESENKRLKEKLAEIEKAVDAPKLRQKSMYNTFLSHEDHHYNDGVLDTHQRMKDILEPRME